VFDVPREASPNEAREDKEIALTVAAEPEAQATQ
jgi:hypothetical protein